MILWPVLLFYYFFADLIGHSLVGVDIGYFITMLFTPAGGIYHQWKLQECYEYVSEWSRGSMDLCHERYEWSILCIQNNINHKASIILVAAILLFITLIAIRCSFLRSALSNVTIIINHDIYNLWMYLWLLASSFENGWFGRWSWVLHKIITQA